MKLQLIGLASFAQVYFKVSAQSPKKCAKSLSTWINKNSRRSWRT